MPKHALGRAAIALAGGLLTTGIASLGHSSHAAYTPQCRQLPGETLVAVTSDSQEAAKRIPTPKREVMTGTYVPPSMPTARLGALDHTRHPSLLQGKRSYRSTAA